MQMLQDRRVIVTGAGSGIGKAIVTRFLAEGAKVIAVVRKAEQVESFTGNDNFCYVVGDINDYQTNADAVALAEEKWGGLDSMIANAGVWDFFKKLQKMTPTELEEGFGQMMNTNVRAVLMAAHASYEALKASGGNLIATGSNACFRPGGGGPLYIASKYALRGVIAQLALDFAPHVRVCGVAPGATDTPIKGTGALNQTEKAMNSDRSRLDTMGEHIPLGRVSEPDEHMGLYVLLASELGASYVTGSILVSDGGLTSGQ
ncbi:SDR family NAD(P)-dependent oxidoreductase [Alteromonas lipolytica]|uniref:Cis-2,3-dihydrobiphenyl-2,3-diol dehydrogenase n=1 Tax=Alteromonas lipolytica TaxID=1856405 RepID=A0A1E8FKD6_9ALTE|nr:SDR family NAD(P)-dependent oxidoreductase [Alteromonas lipolytica]OFI36216.1 cis-2,3-dihydrobiphenyl-2,3-diol dehydrogenase [Alteromonas lipolytica]GGF78849.1 3-(cis-5,6-dihydroxycyclohexa-1, 3-dien-1-yl)propanoate dehydrogenase [Alteromonas lipolytica]